jgi:hypothetical protein
MIYPNPTTNIININADGLIGNIDIYNLNGKLILNDSRLNANHYAIDLIDLPKGSYIIKIKVNDTVVTKKIIKQ